MRPGPCHLDCILDDPGRVTPVVNQLKYHVGMGADPGDFIADNYERGVVPQAYSPLNRAQHTRNFPASASFDSSAQLSSRVSQKGIGLTGRSCCADGSRELISGSLVSGIAASHPGKTGAQVSYKWVVQHDVALCLSADDSDHRVEAYVPCHQLAPSNAPRQQQQSPPAASAPATGFPEHD